MFSQKTSFLVCRLRAACCVREINGKQWEEQMGLVECYFFHMHLFLFVLGQVGTTGIAGQSGEKWARIL